MKTSHTTQIQRAAGNLWVHTGADNNLLVVDAHWGAVQMIW
jgi:hypothetical protein